MNPIKLQKMSHRLKKANILILPGLIYRLIHFRFNSDLHPDCNIGEGTMLGHGGIGVVVNQKAQIGRNCILAQNVTIAGKNGGAPTLGDWCYVGVNSVVIGGVKLGKDVFVGALSLVNKDIPDGAVVAGIPAKVLRIRTKEEIESFHRWVLKRGGVKIDNE